MSKECMCCLLQQANILKCNEWIDLWTDNGELDPELSAWACRWHTKCVMHKLIRQYYNSKQWCEEHWFGITQNIHCKVISPGFIGKATRNL